VEDDPYRVLYLPEDLEEEREEAMPGITGLPPSILSLDTDGRVIHLESLSKWICPGELQSHHQTFPQTLACYLRQF
jgi:DNA-binding transcriptional MocR family regulator